MSHDYTFRTCHIALVLPHKAYQHSLSNERGKGSLSGGSLRFLECSVGKRILCVVLNLQVAGQSPIFVSVCDRYQDPMLVGILRVVRTIPLYEGVFESQHITASFGGDQHTSGARRIQHGAKNDCWYKLSDTFGKDSHIVQARSHSVVGTPPSMARPQFPVFPSPIYYSPTLSETSEPQP